MKKNVVIFLGVLFLFGLILSVCLWFPGYKQRVEWNGDLVETACTVASHSVEKDRCSYNCNCRQVCDYDQNVDNHVCRQKCDTCYRDCFRANYNSNYTVLELGGTFLSFRMNLDTYTSSDGAKQALKSQKPIGSKFLCYYHASQPNDVKTSEYNEHGYFVSAVFFIVLTCILGVAFCFSTLTFYKIIFVQWINDIREPTYDVRKSENVGEMRTVRDSSSSSSSSSD